MKKKKGVGEWGGLVSLSISLSLSLYRVLGQTRVVQEFQQLPDQPRVGHHHVVVGRLPPPGLPKLLGLRVRPKVHVRRVEPHEERLPGLLGARHEVDRLLEALVVDGLHPLLGEGARVGDRAVLAVEDAARGVVLAEVGEVLLGGVVLMNIFFGFFFCGVCGVGWGGVGGVGVGGGGRARELFCCWCCRSFARESISKNSNNPTPSSPGCSGSSSALRW